MSAHVRGLFQPVDNSMSMTEIERRAKLAEWFEERDNSNATVEVVTAFSQASAWELVGRGWTVDSESWQGGWRMGRDKPGWVILLSRPRRWFNEGELP